MISQTTAPGMPVISFRNLSFTYEGGVQALNGVSLDIRPGELLAIVGGNGSGKTTLAKHMIGLLSPSSGEVRVQGRRTSESSVATLACIVGYVFQNPDHQLFCTSVEEEVRFGPENLGLPSSEVSRRTDAALEMMGLEDIRGDPPFSLSLGDRRKVTIASVLSTDPEVLVFDEPTTGLDFEESEQLMGLIGRLNDQGKTIVLITHEMRLVAEHVERVIMMSEGAVVQDSSVTEAFSNLALLRKCELLAPPITELAHRLEGLGIPAGMFTPEQLVLHLRSQWGGQR